MNDPKEIAAGLTEAQREYVLRRGTGYYTISTVRALNRKGIGRLRGIAGLNELGEAVRRELERTER